MKPTKGSGSSPKRQKLAMEGNESMSLPTDGLDSLQWTTDNASGGQNPQSPSLSTSTAILEEIQRRSRNTAALLFDSARQSSAGSGLHPSMGTQDYSAWPYSASLSGIPVHPTSLLLANNILDRRSAALASMNPQFLAIQGLSGGQLQSERSLQMQLAQARAFAALQFTGTNFGFMNPVTLGSHRGILGSEGAMNVSAASLDQGLRADAPNEDNVLGGTQPDPGIPMTLPSDGDNLSEYQCLVRAQIDLFEATVRDIECNAQGRNKPISEGQVGIRCRHCSCLPAGRRSRGAVYFPSKLPGLYQAAQNMAINHFTNSCQTIPDAVRSRMLVLKERKTTVLGGGKQYWANGARVLGIKETDNGLFFDRSSSEGNEKLPSK
jgi:hypothetical protein